MVEPRTLWMGLKRVFSAKCTIGMVRGLTYVMVFDRLPSILLALRAVHEKRIQSKPIMFAQNFSV